MNPKEFFNKVAEMRDAQKAYFKNRFRSDLEKSKQLEREIDAEIKRVKQLTEPQQQTFNFDSK